MQSNGRVNIVVAHGLESKPLIQLFDLQKQEAATAYPVYENDTGIALIVSGIGKPAAAKATNYLATLQAQKDTDFCAWLNIGIAGHRTAELGSAFLVHKIIDLATGESYYPSLLVRAVASETERTTGRESTQKSTTQFETTSVVTVEKIERDYPEDAVYEMEAFGFYSSATRLVTAELIQVYKVISDNSANPVENIDFARVRQWIAGQGESIARLVNRLADLAREVNNCYALPPEFEILSAETRLTATQQVQLKRLCQRYYALERQTELQSFIACPNRSGRTLIQALESGLHFDSDSKLDPKVNFPEIR